VVNQYVEARAGQLAGHFPVTQTIGTVNTAVNHNIHLDGGSVHGDTYPEKLIQPFSDGWNNANISNNL
jgi:hypothetical protein